MEKQKLICFNGKYLKVPVLIGFFILFSGLFNSVYSKDGIGNPEATVSQQQKITLKGTVVDNLGEPVIGANVVEKGTTNGTITDLGTKIKAK